jgi:alkylation response protein AidB-like acyl-CoA dehydrogenase
VVHNAANSYAYAGSGPYVDVSLAKLYACDAFFRIAAENLQIHGGMGCTWEHSAHLLLRRAKTLQHLLGSPAHHRSVIADHLHLLTSGSQGLPNGDKPL